MRRRWPRSTADHHIRACDPEIDRLERIGDMVLTEGLDADPETLRAFLRLAGAPGVDDGPLPEAVANGVRRTQGGRLPGEARPLFAPIREAAIPVLVASGDHTPGIERICGALAAALAAERLVARQALGISSPRRQGLRSDWSASSSRAPDVDGVTGVVPLSSGVG